MLRLALDQFIQRTTWCDHDTQREWFDLLDDLRYHKPGDDYTVFVDLLKMLDAEYLMRLHHELVIEIEKRHARGKTDGKDRKECDDGGDALQGAETH